MSFFLPKHVGRTFKNLCLCKMHFSCFHSQLSVFFPPETSEGVVSMSLNFNIKYRNIRPTIFLFLCKKPRGFPPPFKAVFRIFLFLEIKKENSPAKYPWWGGSGTL